MSGNPFRRSQAGQFGPRPGVEAGEGPAPDSPATMSTAPSSTAVTPGPRVVYDSPESSEAESESVGPSAHHGTRTKTAPTTKVKRVRIETPPPLSPELSVRELQSLSITSSSQPNAGPDLGSPRLSAETGRSATTLPPAISETFPTKFIDPVELGVDKNELIQDPEVERNTRRNSETGSVAGNEPAAQSSMAIANPFKITLATMEGTDKSIEQSARTSRDAPRTGQQMDVQSFTKMLLSGQGEATEKNAEPEARHGRHSRSSSPSLESASESGNESEDSYMNSKDQIDPTTGKKAKPPPPAPRTSRIFQTPAKGPQVVSFEHFAPTESASVNAKQAPKPLPKLPPQDLPLNSHLPASRNVDSTSDSQSPVVRPSLSSVASWPNSYGEHNFEESSLVGSSKTPPPPPLARRSSEKKSVKVTPARQRADSGMSQTSETDEMDADSIMKRSTTSSAQMRSGKAPPPPPARRAGAISTTGIGGSRSGNTSSEVTPVHEQSTNPLLNNTVPTGTASTASRRLETARTASGSVPSSTQPPPPPARRRGSSRSSTDLNLGSGLVNTSSSSAGGAAMYHTGSGSSTPPAAGSARTSAEFVSTQRRSSQDYRRSSQENRRPSQDSARFVQSQQQQQAAARAGAGAGAGANAKAEAQNAQDVLADLTRFQEEVDALRKNQR